MNLSLATDGGSVEISETAFAREYNEALVHQVVVAYMAGARQGTKAQKSRSEVRGGGRKPWRQKGPVEPVRAPSAARSGVGAVQPLPRSRRTTLRK